MLTLGTLRFQLSPEVNMTFAHRSIVVAALAALSLVPQLGCSKLSGKGKVDVGSSVQAPWSRAQKMYPGKVTELHGKLALINFDDGDKGWALVTSLQPAGEPQAAPADACAVKNGDKVTAPWSRTNAMYPGKVTEVHGKLAHVDFDDGDQGWALCAQIKK
jgi:hypothetical protein